MMKQGGGVTSHEGVKVYVDLIVGDLTNIESDYPQTSKLFANFAKYRQGPSNFGFAELDKDARLYNALSKTEDGKVFYDKLRRNMPIITVSTNILGYVGNIDNVKIFKLSNLEKDPLGTLNNIHKTACIDTEDTESEKGDFLDGIERLNKILSIKPGFFGISVNVNQLIDDWIQRKRVAALPRFRGKII